MEKSMGRYSRGSTLGCLLHIVKQTTSLTITVSAGLVCSRSEVVFICYST